VRLEAAAGRPHAVVVGLDCITGLQTARILSQRGVPVVGIVADRRHFCARTRVCKRILTSKLAGQELIDTLRRLGPALPEGGVLFPCTDLSVLALSRHRDELSSWYRLVLPDHDILETLIDKVRFARHAQSHGLAVPKTHILESRSDAEEAASNLAFPAVLKPAVKTADWQRQTRQKAIPLNDSHELLSTYERCSSWASPLLVQEWIDGSEADLYSWNGYYGQSGTPLVSFIARKIRQWPPQTGTSSLGVECRNDAVLAESLRLLTGIGYRGLGYVEMKRDHRTGRHFIIEVNVGRPTGRSAIAEAGGVELLFTAYCDAAGLPLPDRRVQRYGSAKWIYLRHDLQSAVHYWRRGELTFRNWWRSVRGVRADAVLDFHDPLPFAADLLHTARVVTGRRQQATAQWQEPLPASVKFSPSTETNSHS
jgi:D-aspartate ligase